MLVEYKRRMDRLPLPNIVRCPALDLFRRYKYPDDHAIKQFKETEIAHVLEKIIVTEGKGDGEVKVPQTTRAETQ